MLTEATTAPEAVTGPATGPADTRRSPLAVLRPLPLAGARIAGGFWADWQRTNREVTIPEGAQRLREAGNFDNLAIAAGTSTGPYHLPLFLDSDIYKWLEALGWEQGREPSEQLATWQCEATAEVAAAQADDGYLNSYVQAGLARRWENLAWGHEHYCAGHLIQGAVAQARGTGSTGLLAVARRFADLLVADFGPEANRDLDGHPEVETALVELYRLTGEQRYLELARWFVEDRGHDTNDPSGAKSAYFSDRVPVREQTSPEGHAVRAMYLLAGAADVAVETGDRSLLDALGTQFDAMVATKAYLTGGLGSRWEQEAFGAPYELPPDRAYGETCAAIASVHWCWRMLLATGDPRYADQAERTLYNAFLPGLSLDGRRFFYVNPLQLRAGTVASDSRDVANGRRPWFETACCPPNIMRMLASLDSYLATQDDAGVQLHQYAAGPVRAEVGGRRVEMVVATDYPWDGRVSVRVVAGGGARWTLSLRVPAWCAGATLAVTGEVATDVPGGTYAVVRREWHDGDEVELTLPMPARLTASAPEVDATRGCVAIERGPLVYCLEQADQPDVGVDDVELGAGELREEAAAGLPAGVVALRTAGRDARTGRDVELVAVPYHLWANREPGPMRVWVPAAR